MEEHPEIAHHNQHIKCYGYGRYLLLDDRCFLNDDPLPAEHAFLKVSKNKVVWT